MRYLIFLVVLTTMFSCGQNDTKQKELELKDRELALKEKELNLSEKDSAKTTATIDTGKNNFKQEATSTLLVLIRPFFILTQHQKKEKLNSMG
jgi:hypothetical protein